MPIHPIAVVDRVIDEYKRHVATEFRARDPKLRAALEEALEKDGFLAGPAFFQSHRPFKEGNAWRDLGLDDRLAAVLERQSHSKTAFLHQSEAIRHLLDPEGGHLAVTTGTGSGKTECFLVPVLQNAIDDAAKWKRDGLTAILVYPMNALAGDQERRIREYLADSGHTAVRLARYDSSTKEAERADLRKSPPHILLTNYMMLEYLLVRPADRDALFANHRCRFLVLDEVHTYRGSLGSNVALLLRRLREHLARADRSAMTEEAPTLRFVATSATIKTLETSGDEERQKTARETAVQAFLHTMTGAPARDFKVLGEERRAIVPPAGSRFPPTPVHHPAPDPFEPEAVRRAAAALAGLPPQTPLRESLSHGRVFWVLADLLAEAPLSVEKAAQAIVARVPERADSALADVEAEVKTALVTASALGEEVPGAIRLRAHRLLRGGWKFHRCVDPACGALHPRAEASCRLCNKPTAPLLICRACGMDTLRFTGPAEPEGRTLAPYEPPPDEEDDEHREWILYDPSRLPSEADAIEGEDESAASDDTAPPRRKVVKKRSVVKKRPVLRGAFDPESLSFGSGGPGAITVLLAGGRSRCLACDSSAGSGSVLTPVSLGTSAALRVLAQGTVEALAEQHQGDADYRKDPKERLLIFADSRQDAAHQAQFIEGAGRFDRMRHRVVRALRSHPLSIEETVLTLFEEGKSRRDNPCLRDDLGNAISRPNKGERESALAWEEAPLLDDLAVRARFRASLPSLGLVGVSYTMLEDALPEGQGLASSFGLTVPQLAYLCRCLLDEMRLRGALSRDMLTRHPKHPRAPKAFEDADWQRHRQEPVGFACSPEGAPLSYLDKDTVAPGIQVANLWRKPKQGGTTPVLQRVFVHLLERMARRKGEEAGLLALMAFLAKARAVTAVPLHGWDGPPHRLLQVAHGGLELRLLEDADRMHCDTCLLESPFGTEGAPCRKCKGSLVPWPPEEVQSNRYFARLVSDATRPLVAREHTAQVAGDKRRATEEEFNATEALSPVNVLACSPTLEMGIHVSGLEAVLLRNVPPRPDNYAQRAGRAGRKARAGVILGYARNTPHDQYFYDKPADMIAGAVAPPAIALGNRDVVVRHLNAIALGSSTPGLAGRMAQYVDVEGALHGEAVDELVLGFEAQIQRAADLALAAWGVSVLGPVGLGTQEALVEELERQSTRIRGVFERVRAQVLGLRQSVEQWSKVLQGQGAAMRAADLIRRLLGLPASGRDAGRDSDHRSSGHPLRRLAEFGILPGYEFPPEPATLRLYRDANEDEPIQVERRFGIGQYQPGAIVHARGKRWIVSGLDRGSPWNPRSDAAPWVYRVCAQCELRLDATEHTLCPRCKCSDLGGEAIAHELGGFLAFESRAPLLDEEERLGRTGRVRCEPQWGVAPKATYLFGEGLRGEVRQGEEVRWLNERRKNAKENPEGAGFSVCVSCGNTLTAPEEASETTKKGKVNLAPKKGGEGSLHGHAKDCPRRNERPVPFAIVCKTTATTLRLLFDLPRDFADDDYRRVGLSLGYALRAGMRLLYSLDGSEIEVELESAFTVSDDAGTRRRGAVTFVDPTLGGTGFLESAAAQMDRVAKAALSHLDHQDCEEACYRCLKSYQNQRFHGDLSWPHAMPVLEELAAKAPIRRGDQESDLERARAWIRAYEAGVGSPFELRVLAELERRGAKPVRQHGIEAGPGKPIFTVADFAFPDKRVAVYVDGAAFHVGANLRRDKAIRSRLREGTPPWTVVEIRGGQVAEGIESVLQAIGLVNETSLVHVDERYFGDYELVAPLAPGGMAEVFRARHRLTGDLVFLKRVVKGGTDQDALQRELGIYQRLQYANCQHVIQIFGFERDDRFEGLVTELADGGDLEGYVATQGGRLAEPETREIGLQLVAGLAELHDSNVVHRDLKPQNVLLSRGTWKLADFGIAKNRAVYGGKTFQGHGTPAYMAPEQAAGVVADPSADIFSLGRLLAFLLTGMPLPSKVPASAGALRGLILQMTQEDPESRPGLEQVRGALESPG